MTGSVTTQDTSSRAHVPLNRAEKPGRVSADSFRKLTSLLKKPGIAPAPIPALIPTFAPIAAPDVEATPVAAEVREPIVEAIAPLEIREIEAPEEIMALPEALPEIPAEMLAEPALEPVPEPQPVPPPPASEVRATVEPIAEKPTPTLRKKAVIEPPAPPRPRPRVEEMPRPRAETPGPVQTPEQDAEASELARSLLDMMAKGAAAGQPQERALAADTLLRMMPTLPLKSRLMLANRLCLMEQPHHLLVAKLITDPEISVAGPLLEDCAHLTDEDLLRVLAEQDPAKRRMMARRRKISRPVTTALIETDDASVLLTIARNAGAEITAEGFAMMERAARIRGELLAPMCIRADLPVHFAFSLFWVAPPELRRYLLTRFLTDSETLTKILKIARGTHGENADEKIQADPQAVKLALAQAAGGDIALAALPLAEMSGLAPETITRILGDRLGEPLMALLKTLSFPRSQIPDQVEALKGTIIDPTRSSEDLQSMFDSLSFNKARILLTYWDWSSLGTGPYALTQ